MRIEELDHTADLGFEVEADSLARLFEGAALGLLRALGLPAPPAAPGRSGADPEVLELSARGLERLLVGWLRELAWHVQSEQRLPRVADIEVDAGDAGDVGHAGDSGAGGRPAILRARLRWVDAGATPTREVKGVTYHGLRVERHGERWRARVIFDV